MAIHISTNEHSLDNVHEDLHKLPPAARFRSQEDMEVGSLLGRGIYYHNTHICRDNRPQTMSTGAEAMGSIVTWLMLPSPRGGCYEWLQCW